MIMDIPELLNLYYCNKWNNQPRTLVLKEESIELCSNSYETIGKILCKLLLCCFRWKKWSTVIRRVCNCKFWRKNLKCKLSFTVYWILALCPTYTLIKRCRTQPKKSSSFFKVPCYYKGIINLLRSARCVHVQEWEKWSGKILRMLFTNLGESGSRDRRNQEFITHVFIHISIRPLICILCLRNNTEITQA